MKRRFSLPAPWMTAGAYLLTLAALAGLIWAPAALLKGQDASLYGQPLTVEPAQGALTEEGRAYPLAQTMYDRTHVWSEQWLQWEDAGMNEAAARDALTDALDKLAEADVLDAQLTALCHDALSHAAQYAAGRDGMGFLDLRWTLFATRDGEILDPAKARDTQEQIFTAAYFLSATVEPRTGVPVALTLMAALKELPPAVVPAEVERCARAVNLSAELDKRLAAYSGGMKQRLLAACALLGQPQLLILDEPTAGLDPRERVRLRALLKELSRTRIVLVATHVVSDVESVADEILLLRAGQLVDKGTPGCLQDKYAPGGTLEDVYLHIFSEENDDASADP